MFSPWWSGYNWLSTVQLSFLYWYDRCFLYGDMWSFGDDWLLVTLLMVTLLMVTLLMVTLLMVTLLMVRDGARADVSGTDQMGQ
jgi:low affinity Fe/Cu permease